MCSEWNYKVFWCYDNCWSETHHCFPCRMSKWALILFASDILQHLFPWDEKSTLRGEHNCGALYVAKLLWYFSLHTYSATFVILYICTFSPSLSLSLTSMGILDGRTRGCFLKDKVYWSCNIPYPAWKPNKIKVIFLNIVPNCALRNVN